VITALETRGIRVKHKCEIESVTANKVLGKDGTGQTAGSVYCRACPDFSSRSVGTLVAHREGAELLEERHRVSCCVNPVFSGAIEMAKIRFVLSI